MKYIGFDLGDGESAVAVLSKDTMIEPYMLQLSGVQSIISAVGIKNGSIVIGEDACTIEDVKDMHVRFKSHFLTDENSISSITLFAKGILREIAKNCASSLDADTCITVGCPAGWGQASRERYGKLMLEAGFPKVSIVSESRAAFLYAKYSRNIQVDPALLIESTLVIDIGSSTTDFAYIVDGHETNMGTFGDVRLGGGVLDSHILQEAINNSKEKEKIKEVLAESASWYSFCELAARKLKEQYFTYEEAFAKSKCEKSVNIYYDDLLTLNLSITPVSIWGIVNKPLPELGGRSFAACLQEALNNAAKLTVDKPPKLVLLTGGASRMAFFQNQCRETFENAVIVCCPEPEFSIARGLAYAGRVDENLFDFRKAIYEFTNSGTIENIVKPQIHEVFPIIVAIIADELLEQAAIPVMDQWLSGSIEKLDQMDDLLKSKIEIVLASEKIKEKMIPAISDWAGKLCVQLQKYLDPICDKYNVSRDEMNLFGVHANPNVGNINFSINDVLGLDTIGMIVSTVIGIIGGMICGGGGLALIATGIPGFVAGALVGIIAAAMGFKRAKELIMQADIPIFLRKLIPRNLLLSGIQRKKGQLSSELMRCLSGSDKEFFNKLCESVVSKLIEKMEQMAKAAEMQLE